MAAGGASCCCVLKVFQGFALVVGAHRIFLEARAELSPSAALWRQVGFRLCVDVKFEAAICGTRNRSFMSSLLSWSFFVASVMFLERCNFGF